MSENHEGIQELELQMMARNLVELAYVSVFNRPFSDIATMLNKLVAAKETGIKALLDYVASSNLGDARIDALLSAIQISGHSLKDFSEETGQAAISFLLEHILNSKSTDIRRIALTLQGEILAWSFPEKKEAVAQQILGLLFDEDPAIRYSMIQYVRMHQLKAAVPHLITLLNSHEDHQSYYVRQALKALDSPAAVLALQEWEKRNQKGRA